MGSCLGKFRKEENKKAAPDRFPLQCSETTICDYYVDALPSRLQGEGIHLLRRGPGPIVQGWTHELLKDAGVSRHQDRELLLSTRDKILAAVELHRERRRQAGLASLTEGACTSRRSLGRLSRNLLNGEAAAAAAAAAAGTAEAGAAGGVAATGGTLSSPGDTVGKSETAHGLSAVDAAIAAKLAAVKAAAAAAAEAAAAGLGPDGQPFSLTSDWLSARVELYRISEERFRHMGTSALPSPDVSCRGAVTGGLHKVGSSESLANGSPPTPGHRQYVHAKSRLSKQPSDDGAEGAGGSDGSVRGGRDASVHSDRGDRVDAERNEIEACGGGGDGSFLGVTEDAKTAAEAMQMDQLRDRSHDALLPPAPAPAFEVSAAVMAAQEKSPLLAYAGVSQDVVKVYDIPSASSPIARGIANGGGSPCSCATAEDDSGRGSAGACSLGAESLAVLTSLTAGPGAVAGGPKPCAELPGGQGVVGGVEELHSGGADLPGLHLQH
ncbi:hypothetical protein Agub_g12235 [Astrephomene gubernaculifera]|uniref:Uncharacterized protein n=1 Tax=Astrephomene gubernaculifera TaxID=47775 RepID=A0AAD3HRM2_9CHLO|nr:hypothetical protein Agub_g12235 [Astrephomene gubernaculifera]